MASVQGYKVSAGTHAQASINVTGGITTHCAGLVNKISHTRLVITINAIALLVSQTLTIF